MAAKTITRRKLIKNSVIAGIGTSFLLNSPIKVFGRKSNPLTKVVLVRDTNVLNPDGSAGKAMLEQMLDKALIELTGEPEIKDAWKKILKSEDVLGIKTNVWNKLPTPAQLEEVLVEKAEAVGIKAENISVRDRGLLEDKVFTNSTALINVRPMRTHAWAGVGSLLKNYITFAEKPSDYHPDSCADLAGLWKLPIIEGKTRLNILVMLTPLFHGIGPHHFNKQYVWNYYGLIVGFDPVAVDSVGLRIIEAKRNTYFGEYTPLNPPAKHIEIADSRHGLGTADPEKIDLVKIGWEEDILI